MRPRKGRAVVFGCGSIGSRHVQNLVSLGYEVGVVTSVSRLPEGQGISRVTRDDVAGAPEQFDFAVIANRTELHLETTAFLARLGLPLLIEKPLAKDSRGASEVLEVLLQNQTVTKVGFVLRFHPCILFMQKLLARPTTGSVLGVTTSMGSWLKEWRTNIDYQQSDSAHSGVILDMVHEFDYLRVLFGRATRVFARTSRSSLIDTPCDWADISIQTERETPIALHLDFLDRATHRRTRIVTDQETLEMDLVKGTITSTQGGELQSLFNDTGHRNDMYFKQLEEFFRLLQNPFQADHLRREWGDALYAVDIATACRQSGDTGKEVIL